MKDQKFEVGQQVITTRDQIGTVERITPTGRIVVRFTDKYKETFRRDGRSYEDNPWFRVWITPLTDEDLKRLKEKKVIANCRQKFQSEAYTISYDQAVKILEILNGDEQHE